MLLNLDSSFNVLKNIIKNIKKKIKYYFFTYMVSNITHLKI
jgi:hypothetical protein